MGWWAGAAAVPVAGFFLGPTLIERLSQDVYTAGVGETRRVMLADGSAIELNTRSKVRVRMTPQTREVFLEEGEAFFQAALDPLRPFRVHSGPVVIRAPAAQFNVYRQPARTLVTAIEGQVIVNGAAKLTAGHRIIAVHQPDGADSFELSPADPRRTMAWRDHRLIFDDETVAAAVAEFNRYNKHPLFIEDPRLRERRVSGVFEVSRPEGFVRYMVKRGEPGVRLAR